MFQDWLVPPEQSQIWSGVASAELTQVASRHLPDAVFTNWLDAVCVQACAPVPLQVNNCTFVPLAVPAPATSRHLPRDCRVLPETVHDWAAVPLHVNSWIWVPSAGFAPATSTHLPPMPVIWPVCGVPPPPVLCVPLHVNVADVAAGSEYVKCSPPQLTVIVWAELVPLYATSAFEPSGFCHATLGTVPLALESMRNAPGLTNLVSWPVS